MLPLCYTLTTHLLPHAHELWTQSSRKLAVAHPPASIPRLPILPYLPGPQPGEHDVGVHGVRGGVAERRDLRLRLREGGVLAALVRRVLAAVR